MITEIELFVHGNRIYHMDLNGTHWTFKHFFRSSTDLLCFVCEHRLQ